jgi:hypothetical protein
MAKKSQIWRLIGSLRIRVVTPSPVLGDFSVHCSLSGLVVSSSFSVPSLDIRPVDSMSSEGAKMAPLTIAVGKILASLLRSLPRLVAGIGIGTIIEIMKPVARNIRRRWEALRGKKRKSGGRTRHRRKTRRRTARGRHRNRSEPPWRGGERLFSLRF